MRLPLIALTGLLTTAPFVAAFVPDAAAWGDGFLLAPCGGGYDLVLAGERDEGSWGFQAGYVARFQGGCISVGSLSVRFAGAFDPAVGGCLESEAAGETLCFAALKTDAFQGVYRVQYGSNSGQTLEGRAQLFFVR